MDLIKLDHENVQKAKDYLASIGKLEEYNLKKVDAAQWSSIILFANQQIVAQNTNQNNQQ